MRNIVLSFLIATSTFSISKQAHADFYLGASAGNIFVDIEDYVNKKNHSGDNMLFQSQLGYFVNNYLAGEIRYGTAIKRQDQFLIDNIYSAYVRGNVPVSPRTSIYGLLGVTRLELDGFNSQRIKEHGLSYGLGAHYALNSTAAVFAEFNNTEFEIARLLESEMVSKTLNLGFQYRF